MLGQGNKAYKQAEEVGRLMLKKKAADAAKAAKREGASRPPSHRSVNSADKAVLYTRGKGVKNVHKTATHQKSNSLASGHSKGQTKSNRSNDTTSRASSGSGSISSTNNSSVRSEQSMSAKRTVCEKSQVTPILFGPGGAYEHAKAIGKEMMSKTSESGSVSCSSSAGGDAGGDGGVVDAWGKPIKKVCIVQSQQVPKKPPKNSLGRGGAYEQAKAIGKEMMSTTSKAGSGCSSNNGEQVDVWGNPVKSLSKRSCGTLDESIGTATCSIISQCESLRLNASALMEFVHEEIERHSSTVEQMKSLMMVELTRGLARKESGNIKAAVLSTKNAKRYEAECAKVVAALKYLRDQETEITRLLNALTLHEQGNAEDDLCVGTAKLPNVAEQVSGILSQSIEHHTSLPSDEELVRELEIMENLYQGCEKESVQSSILVS